MSHSSFGEIAMPTFATMPKTATTAITATEPMRMGRLRPSNRRKMSASATALARTKNGTKSPRYLGAI